MAGALSSGNRSSVSSPASDLPALPAAASVAATTSAHKTAETARFFLGSKLMRPYDWSLIWAQYFCAASRLCTKAGSPSSDFGKKSKYSRHARFALCAMVSLRVTR